jgi:ABC-type lipoprotein export system ATPase subunit
MENIISVRNLEKTYLRGAETVHALKGVSFDIQKGEFTAVTGPSGSGKTTLLHIIGCLDRPTAGSVSINGRCLEKMSEKELLTIRRNKVGFVFQQFYLMPGLTVEENIMLPLLFSRKKKDNAWIKQILESVGLSNRARHLPNQLSGGEMQRVAIGRALVNGPDIILADEPTANLDSENTESIFKLLRDLVTEGITVVLVTHNQSLASRTDRIIRLTDGRLNG